MRVAGQAQKFDSHPKSGYMAQDTWHSFVVTRANAAGTIVLYVDNVQGPIQTDSNLTGTFTIDQLLRESSSAKPWRDRIFDFRIYNSLLTSDQRIEVGNFQQATGATLLRWYQMQRQHATIVYDASGNEQHGTKSFTDFAAWHYSGADVPHDYIGVPQSGGLSLSLGISL